LQKELEAEDEQIKSLSWMFFLIVGSNISCRLGRVGGFLNQIFFEKENGNDHFEVRSTAPSLCFFLFA